MEVWGVWGFECLFGLGSRLGGDWGGAKERIAGPVSTATVGFGRALHLGIDNNDNLYW